MKPHRLSYLKAVVAALGAAAVSLSLAALWLAAGQAWVPLTGWVLLDSGVLVWIAVGCLGIVGLVCLLVAIGGSFALLGDAREGRAHADPGTQG